MAEDKQFKDLFSTQATDYARFRPRYPKALFDFLAKSTEERKLAWDVGTGNGQAALILASHFEKVIATDPSEKQLAEAVPHEKIEYRINTAEDSGLASGTVDLITVAQAFHWFRQPEFFAEVERVAKPGAILAIWCYELCKIDARVDDVVLELYKDILGNYWEKERRLVEQGYANEKVPFEEIPAPKVVMGTEWGIADLVGYLGTWSALQKFRKENSYDPRGTIMNRLQSAWGDLSKSKAVSWPLGLRIFRISKRDQT